MFINDGFLFFVPNIILDGIQYKLVAPVTFSNISHVCPFLFHVTYNSLSVVFESEHCTTFETPTLPPGCRLLKLCVIRAFENRHDDFFFLFIGADKTASNYSSVALNELALVLSNLYASSNYGSVSFTAVYDTLAEFDP